MRVWSGGDTRDRMKCDEVRRSVEAKRQRQAHMLRKRGEGEKSYREASSSQQRKRSLRRAISPQRKLKPRRLLRLRPG